MNIRGFDPISNRPLIGQPGKSLPPIRDLNRSVEPQEFDKNIKNFFAMEGGGLLLRGNGNSNNERAPKDYYVSDKPLKEYAGRVNYYGEYLGEKESPGQRLPSDKIFGPKALKNLSAVRLY
eukprot:TRINITY_DN25094_c0_g1_i1.p1 TRINITY_DN25094_c0_g1~~TRINITY_DN25094_c0_g1_i1.p1  ORF type:complete len:121 (-),score=23.90 TRINITY_DN25094_c0_g1_i1:3-365(-)